jgi:tRNA-2-methylthio-N6-dimethylallyladenosine synthase
LPRLVLDCRLSVSVLNITDNFKTFEDQLDGTQKEISGLVDSGYKEITLLGQNVNSYGLDKKGEEISFPDLLRKIGEMGNAHDKEFWVYFTSPHPRDMTEEVIEVISQYDCLAKQIHIPIQSGDDKVLIRMNLNSIKEKIL